MNDHKYWGIYGVFGQYGVVIQFPSDNKELHTSIIKINDENNKFGWQLTITTNDTDDGHILAMEGVRAIVAVKFGADVTLREEVATAAGEGRDVLSD